MAYQYKVAGQPVILDVDPALVAVPFAEERRGEKAVAPTADGAEPLPGGLDLHLAGVSIVAALEAKGIVEGAQPVFKVGDVHAVNSGRVIVGVAPDCDVDGLLADHGLTLLSREHERVLARIADGADVFAVVDRLDGDPRTLYAEPDLVLFGTRLPQRPAAAPAAAEAQYALQITSTTAAWAIQQGNPAVRVAILDDGVDIAHHDLAPAVAATYDAIDKVDFQTPNPSDWHGTACAGLAIARKTGPGSVAGVGAGASLVAVRIARSHRPRGAWETSEYIIAHAIDWVWRTGRAHVISNSWTCPPSNAVMEAITRARTQGRGGLGTVVLAATGNHGGAVAFPANMPDVLAVAASNQFDEAKTFDSTDNETFWASCYGSQVDVAAPGVQNRTTDVTGGLGYSGDDYTPGFNGTSSATPLVAGACALLLARNPNMTEAQVRHLITVTADKVGQFGYHNGRNDYMGHGRLNVLAAVRAA